MIAGQRQGGRLEARRHRPRQGDSRQDWGDIARQDLSVREQAENTEMVPGSRTGEMLLLVCRIDAESCHPDQQKPEHTSQS
jgi:hypothetical protein